MPCACSDVQRRRDLQHCQHQAFSESPPFAAAETYSSSETRREWDPGNEPRHYSPPVRAVFVVAIAAVWVVHSIDVIRLLVHDPIVS